MSELLLMELPQVGLLVRVLHGQGRQDTLYVWPAVQRCQSILIRACGLFAPDGLGLQVTTA